MSSKVLNSERLYQLNYIFKIIQHYNRSKIYINVEVYASVDVNKAVLKKLFVCRNPTVEKLKDKSSYKNYFSFCCC